MRFSRLLQRLARLLPQRRRSWIALAVALLLLPALVLGVAAAFTPLPEALRGSQEGASVSTVFLDRHGTVLCETRAGDGNRARRLRLDDAGERAIRAVIAAEDKRFFYHPGVDPLAVLRAAGQLVTERRVISGGSTITQQLARTLVPRPRTFWGKLGEMALAVRIEASLSKDAILEEYLNRVAFGPGLRGIEAASRFYFDKPTQDLSLAEAASLAGLPRGPSLYDPRRGAERLLRRRDRVLGRMAESGAASEDDVQRARAEPFVLAPRGSGLGIPHLRRALTTGALDASAGPLAQRASSVTTTVDRGLQREIELLAQATVERLAAQRVSAASVVVLENATGEILAYVGSPDIENAARLGHNDGVLARRQPGSSLKPFVYGLAMERLGLTAASALPDVDLHFPTPEGDYHPHNYDGRFHGLVRAREALASSFNVPAVVLAARVGPEALLARLHDLGFASLDRPARHYGLGLALGDGEVQLVELAAAYATLARGGLFLPPRAVRAALDPNGKPLALAPAAPRRVLDARAAFVLTDVLSDAHARLATFGEGSALELPFPVAAKTGTSKGFRDNVAVGFTPEITVAVWVGNFDGSPMQGVSGVTGAGPLFHDAMLAAVRAAARGSQGAFTRPEGLLEVEVCALSGARPTSACPHRRTEIVPREAAGALASCDVHVRARVDRRNGLLAGPACASADERVFERFDSSLVSWARGAGRPLLPLESSPFCPTPEEPQSSAARLRIAYPPDGARFVHDPAIAAQEGIRVRVDAPDRATSVRLLVDGRAFELRPPFERTLPLVPGTHVLRVEAAGATSDAVTFSVD